MKRKIPKEPSDLYHQMLPDFVGPEQHTGNRNRIYEYLVLLLSFEPGHELNMKVSAPS